MPDEERPGAGAVREKFRLKARLVFLAHFLIPLIHLLIPLFVLAMFFVFNLNPEVIEEECQGLYIEEGIRLEGLAKQGENPLVESTGEGAICSADVLDRLATSLSRDHVLVAVIFVTLVGAAALTWRERRWRPGAALAFLFACCYVLVDVTENRLLFDLLHAGSWSGRLPWASNLKWGFLLGALPIYLISFALSAGKSFEHISEDHKQVAEKEDKAADAQRAQRRKPGKTLKAAVVRCRRRLFRVGNKPVSEPAREVPPTDGLGICCSGGGIRSAAFNLGALQALESCRTNDRESGNELRRASWLCSVSGGSYIATAWMTARNPANQVSPEAWARFSAEEDHLRRHSSYLAPGFGGKLWAISRFLFGFVVNFLVVTLFLAALFLPAGWLIDRFEVSDPKPVSGTVELPEGGCIQKRSGRRFVAVPGTKLQMKGLVRWVDEEPSTSLREGRNSGGFAQAGDPDGRPSGARHDLCNRIRAGNVYQPAPSAEALDLELKKGERTEVKLLDGKEKPTVSGGFRGCPFVRGSPELCDIQAQRQGTEGGRVIFSPRTVLELKSAAIVDKDGLLSEPCGTRHVCQSLKAPGPLVLSVWLVFGITFLLGVGLVLTRATPASAKWIEWAVQRLAVLTILVVGLGLAFPALVKLAEDYLLGIEDIRIKVGGGTATGLALLGGLLAQITPLLRNMGSEPGEKSGLGGWLRRLPSRFRPLLVGLAGAVVGPLLVLALAVGFASHAALEAQGQWRPHQIAIWLGVIGPLVTLLSGGDLNEWSLHPFYRDRLRSAFAVDPRINPPKDPREDELWKLPSTGPQLIIAAAVNIADERVTSPGRPVASWTFTRDRMGCHLLSKVPSAGEERSQAWIELRDPDRFPDACLPASLLRLGWSWTSVAVSGAAFAPSMGKLSRPERFLLALGNLRLGVWYPNPTLYNRDRTYYLHHHPRPWYLAKEALGLHSADDPWLYVTDGAHYESLGLVELLRRGCRQIYCFDATGDPIHTFGTFADAMRLAREEMDIQIDFDPGQMVPQKTGESALGVSAATVKFPDEERPSGWLVLAKLTVPRNAPFDIVDLARTLPSFPNHPTSDQLYTDQKFEAYRALGFYLGEQAARLGRTIIWLEESGDTVAHAVAKANARLREES